MNNGGSGTAHIITQVINIDNFNQNNNNNLNNNNIFAGAGAGAAGVNGNLGGFNLANLLGGLGQSFQMQDQNLINQVLQASLDMSQQNN
jgi:hypothetical protein